MNFLLFQKNLNYIILTFTLASIFVIHLVNGAQFLNAICVAGAATTVILPLTKM